MTMTPVTDKTDSVEEVSEREQAFSDREWWRQAGEQLGLELRGWTFRNTAVFSDCETGSSVELPGSVAARLNRRSIANTAGEDWAGKPANFASWKGQLHRLEAIIHELAGDVAANGPEDRAWAIIGEMLEGFEDVAETEAALAALTSPPVGTGKMGGGE